MDPTASLDVVDNKLPGPANDSTSSVTQPICFQPVILGYFVPSWISLVLSSSSGVIVLFLSLIKPATHTFYAAQSLLQNKHQTVIQAF